MAAESRRRQRRLQRLVIVNDVLHAKRATVLGGWLVWRHDAPNLGRRRGRQRALRNGARGRPNVEIVAERGEVAVLVFGLAPVPARVGSLGWLEHQRAVVLGVEYDRLALSLFGVAGQLLAWLHLGARGRLVVCILYPDRIRARVGVNLTL